MHFRTFYEMIIKTHVFLPDRKLHLFINLRFVFKFLKKNWHIAASTLCARFVACRKCSSIIVYESYSSFSDIYDRKSMSNKTIRHG